MSENITIQVYRYDPEKDTEGGLVQYSLLKLPGMRILGALKALNDQGHNISYRYNCEEWECGSCAVYINGNKSVLACKTEVQDKMVIEPVPDMKVLKDLIVDREKENKKQAELYNLPTTKIGSDLAYEVQNSMWQAITCMECGICLASCPVLHPAGGSYTYSGPEYMIQLFRTELDTRVEKHTLEISKKEGIWECTVCRHCVENCPQNIPILDQILYLRNKIIDEKGELVPPEIRDLNERLFRTKNPYGKPKKRRSDWAEGLNVPDMQDGPQDILFFVGSEQCYNPRDQEIAKAMVDVFRSMKIGFGTLGTDEADAGESALSTGEQALFEELSEINIKSIQKSKFKAIVTASPHDYHVVKNEYPKFGGNFNVLHYTEFIDEMIRSKKLKFANKCDKSVVYHDPCFLGRYNQIFDAPRNVLKAIPELNLVEMNKNRENAECCGGGGGGAFIDIPAGERIPERRVAQALETGAQILAVACPFCLAMFEDAAKTLRCESKIEIKHIIELVRDAL